VLLLVAFSEFSHLVLSVAVETFTQVRRAKLCEFETWNLVWFVYASTWALESARQITDATKLRLLHFGCSLPESHTEYDVARIAVQNEAARPGKREQLFVGANWERKDGDVAVQMQGS